MVVDINPSRTHCKWFFAVKLSRCSVSDFKKTRPFNIFSGSTDEALTILIRQNGLFPATGNNMQKPRINIRLIYLADLRLAREARLILRSDSLILSRSQ
jgi:hypothetical protein